MKRTRLFLIGAMAMGVTFASCGGYGDNIGKQQLYNNATLVDTEGFIFFKTAHEKLAYELAHAQHALNQGVSGEAAVLAEKIVATYPSLLPVIDSLGAEKQVISNDPGALVFSVTPDTASTDSLNVVVFNQESYMAHVQKEQAEILNQFKRASRNTDKDLSKFASEQLEVIKEIYTLAGGHVDDSHH